MQLNLHSTLEHELFMQEQNPIDEDKVAENPGLLPYASNVGGFLVKPLDKGKIKGIAMQAMEEQANIQLQQIREQIELLAKQAKDIKERAEISQHIYTADMNFQPIIGKTYHLYKRKDEGMVMSMVGPNEWGRSMPFAHHVSTVRLLADHTWEILRENRR